MKLSELRLTPLDKDQYRKYLIVNVFKFKNGSYKVNVVCSDNMYFPFDVIDIPKQFVELVDIEDGYLIVPKTLDVKYYPNNGSAGANNIVYLDLVK